MRPKYTSGKTIVHETVAALWFLRVVYDTIPKLITSLELSLFLEVFEIRGWNMVEA